MAFFMDFQKRYKELKESYGITGLDRIALAAKSARADSAKSEIAEILREEVDGYIALLRKPEKIISKRTVTSSSQAVQRRYSARTPLKTGRRRTPAEKAGRYIEKLTNGSAGTFSAFDQANAIFREGKLMLRPSLVRVDDGKGGWKVLSGLNQLLLLQQCGALGYPSSDGVFYVKRAGQGQESGRHKSRIYNYSSSQNVIKSYFFVPSDKKASPETEAEKKKDEKGYWMAESPDMGLVTFLATYCAAARLNEEISTTTATITAMGSQFAEVMSEMTVGRSGAIDFNKFNALNADIDRRTAELLKERAQTISAGIDNERVPHDGKITAHAFAEILPERAVQYTHSYSIGR